METTQARIENNEVVWHAPDVQRERHNKKITYHEISGDEIETKRIEICVSTYELIDRLQVIVELLYKAHMIKGEYYALLASILREGEEAMANNYGAVFDHLGPVYVEKSGDEIVGVVLEMKDVR